MRATLEVDNSTLHVLRLFNMSTLTREWIAVQHAHLLPIGDILLTGGARPPAAESKRMDVPPGMRATIGRECNTSQARARCASGFSAAAAGHSSSGEARPTPSNSLHQPPLLSPSLTSKPSYRTNPPLQPKNRWRRCRRGSTARRWC